jgi:Undecaprenyl-phosphate glucose phosphotransferase
VGVAAAAGDFLLVPAIAGAAALAYSRITGETMTGSWIGIGTLAGTLFVAGFERIGGYKVSNLYRMKWQVLNGLAVWAVAVSCLLFVAFVERSSGIYSRAWVLSWVAATPGAWLCRSCCWQRVLAACNRAGYFARNVVVVGAGAEGRRLIEKIRRSNDKSIAIRGVFDDQRSPPRSVGGVSVLGTTDDLLRFARAIAVDEVVVALPLNAERQLRQLCEKMKALAVDVRLSIDPLAELFQVRRTGYIANIPVIEVIDRPLKSWRGMLKWIEDKSLAALLFILVAPVMTAIAVLIKFDSPGPVFFVQQRFGFNNEVIRVLKFRTMGVDGGDPSGAQRTVADDPRVTPLGRTLRALSLDELPQLINVLRGDMSLVGPRPHAVAMKVGERLYGDAVNQYLHRHRVKPGITGWAQVNGFRGEVDTLDKARRRVELDLHYIAHWSVWLDLKILLMTVGVLIARTDAY